jgi:glucuronate isomerase
VKVRLDGDYTQHVYDQIAERLASPEFRPRRLFERFNIEVLATTDAASDSLEHHRALRASGWRGRVIPTFRPDAVFRIAAPEWASELECLGQVNGEAIPHYPAFIDTLGKRRAVFKSLGGTATDHAVVEPFASRLSDQDASAIFVRALRGEATPSDQRRFEAHMLMEMARMSVEDGLVMQLHPGALRTHNRQVFDRFGPDRGADIPVGTEYTRNRSPLLNAYGNDERFARAVHWTNAYSRSSRRRRTLSGAAIGPPWWYHVDRGDDAIPAAGHGGDLQHRRFQRRHARLLLDSGATISRRVDASSVARHVASSTMRG